LDEFLRDLQLGTFIEYVDLSMKTYTMRSVTVDNGKNSVADLCLEFDGQRAFVIWDTIMLGTYQLKARLEIDPKRLKKARSQTWDYFYRGELVLPRPQDN